MSRINFIGCKAVTGGFIGRIGFALSLLVLLSALVSLPLTAIANGDDDHSKGKEQTAGNSAASAVTVSIITAERNIQNEGGQFTLVLKRSPGDPRVGETEQLLLVLSEKVEGGFGSGPLPIEKAVVLFNVLRPDGTVIRENLSVTEESGGIYRGSYVFDVTGDYKIVFNVSTADNRAFTADFPIAVSRAPVRSSFWIGFLILSILTLGSLGAIFYAAKRKDSVNYRKFAPFAAAALLILVFSTLALTYFLPPREMREVAVIPSTAATTTTENALAAQTTIVVPKESQLLFGIKTEPVSVRQITSGLKTSGAVRARPDAQAVVVPPVAGRIVLREGITIGSAVSRGEQIGSVEQILDVSGQVGLETQRLDVEAQRLELRNTTLSLQGQQAQQRAAASQSRTRLAQANRELRRSKNLVEVGAVPQKRVEEAQTAVKVAEQEVASSEQQVKLLDTQIKAAQSGQAVFSASQVNQPTRFFALTAPVTGIVNEIKATSGQQVETATQILTISNLSTVLIEAQVFEKDLPIVRESTRASFTASALSGEVYNIGTGDGDGRLISIGQTVDPQTRTVPVIYEMKNPLQRLRDGMFVEITIDTSGNQQVLAVPKQSVVNEQGQTFVFVFTGGENFEKRPVALGAEGADFYEVKSGLKEGERVVTEGVYQLRTTQPGA